MNSKYHPCEGKRCEDCETCKFDEPIILDSEKKSHDMKSQPCCNYCGYIIKSYHDGEVKFKASCSKCLLEINGTKKPREIADNVNEIMHILTPDWCPKRHESPKSSSVDLLLKAIGPINSTSEQYRAYHEKKKVLQQLPRHVNWEDIKEGGLYVIPTIMKQKLRVVRVLSKTLYTARCAILDENSQETSDIHNVYKEDLDTTFIVEYHKY